MTKPAAKGPHRFPAGRRGAGRHDSVGGEGLRPEESREAAHDEGGDAPRVRFALGAAAGAMDPPNQTRGLMTDQVYQSSAIDHINTFNGGLSLTIPIGRSYRASPSLSYGLTLAYNSNVWIYEERVDGADTYVAASPDPLSNAGLGWMLSLGEFLPASEQPDGREVYVSPSGAKHKLFEAMHEGDETSPTVYYSRDGSYLRRTLPDGNTSKRRIEFPDGEMHTLANSAGDGWRFERAEDRAGQLPGDDRLDRRRGRDLDPDRQPRPHPTSST